jgi:hypothetical protein
MYPVRSIKSNEAGFDSTRYMLAYALFPNDFCTQMRFSMTRKGFKAWLEEEGEFERECEQLLHMDDKEGNK